MNIDIGELIRSGLPERVREWFGDEEMGKLAEDVYGEITMRLGERLCRRLTPGEIDEFDELNRSPDVDELQTAEWLNRKIPDLHHATKACIEEVVAEATRTLMAVYEREHREGGADSTRK